MFLYVVNFKKFEMNNMYLLSPESLLFVVQNLFLYGYGAIFNFLGIVITAMFKGMDIKYAV